MTIENNSCKDCIWQEQCSNENACAHFSPIHEDIEIEILTSKTQNRFDYYEEYCEYLADRGDSNYDLLR